MVDMKSFNCAQALEAQLILYCSSRVVDYTPKTLSNIFLYDVHLIPGNQAFNLIILI